MENWGTGKIIGKQECSAEHEVTTRTVTGCVQTCEHPV